MRKLSFMADIDLCFGCFACETACKQEHNLPVSTKWMHVVRVGPEEIGGRLMMDFVPTHCHHCENPPCLKVCPAEGAITKRADGIVVYNTDLCIGCKSCIEACPFGVAVFNPEIQRAQACNMCHERVDRGLAPACVQNCPTQALFFGVAEEFTRHRRERQAHAFLQRRSPELFSR